MTAEILHKCIVCGHLHDEATEGKWEELTADFTCPEYEVGKEDYEAELWHSV
jgi:rubredoxin